MVQCIGKIGTVHRITDRGDVRVQYDGANNRWTFHAGSLTKVKCDVISYDLLLLINLHLYYIYVTLKSKEKRMPENSDSLQHC